jgi:hypothetical protein
LASRNAAMARSWQEAASSRRCLRAHTDKDHAMLIVSASIACLILAPLTAVVLWAPDFSIFETDGRLAVGHQCEVVDEMVQRLNSASLSKERKMTACDTR